MDIGIEVNNNINRVNAWDLVKYYIKPLAEFLDNPDVTEICVNRFDEVYIERKNCFERVDINFGSNKQLEKLIEQIGKALNQPVHNEKFPVLDARLPRNNGRIAARINAVMTPVATRGANLTIRIFPNQILTAQDLIAQRTLTPDMLEFLKIAVHCRCNIIISGGTGSGKTTLTNVLCGFIPKTDRVISIEDTAELQIDRPHLVSLEAARRRINQHEETQYIDMSFLLCNALRQRPDRIIVGEIRSSDAASSFLQAINTGHSGCITTLHANSTSDALLRLTMLAAATKQALPHEIITTQVRGNIHLLIHQQRIPGEGRRIVEITEIENLRPRSLWYWQYKNKLHITEQKAYQHSAVLKQAKQCSIDVSLL